MTTIYVTQNQQKVIEVFKTYQGNPKYRAGSIARQLGYSAAHMRNKLKDLEKKGIISGGTGEQAVLNESISIKIVKHTRELIVQNKKQAGKTTQKSKKQVARTNQKNKKTSKIERFYFSSHGEKVRVEMPIELPTNEYSSNGKLIKIGLPKYAQSV